MRKRVPWGVAPVIIVLVGIFCFRADATTMKAYAMEDLVAESDLVVIGSAIKVEHHKDVRGKIVRTVDFQVDTYIVGKGPSQIVLQLAGGTIGNVRTRVFGSLELNVNETVLLFIRKSLKPGQGTYYPVGMRQGRFNVLQDGQTGARFVARTLDGVNLVNEIDDDPMGIGRGRVCVFVSLERFVSRIRKILGITEDLKDE